jgi:hypothetical protein
MATNERITVVGVFVRHGDASQAIDALRQAGLPKSEIGYVARRDALAEGTHAGSGPAMDLGAETGEQAAHEFTGALKGTAIGGLLGAGAALIPGIGPVLAGEILGSALVGAGAGAATGGLIGAFRHLGVSENEARAYERELRDGRILVTVQQVSQHAEVREILRRHGGTTPTA